MKLHFFILFATETSASSSNGRLRSMLVVVMVQELLLCSTGLTISRLCYFTYAVVQPPLVLPFITLKNVLQLDKETFGLASRPNIW